MKYKKTDFKFKFICNDVCTLHNFYQRNSNSNSKEKCSFFSETTCLTKESIFSASEYNKVQELNGMK